VNLEVNPDSPIKDEDPDGADEKPAEGVVESSEDSASEA
jgi:hypothetical protein